VPSNKRVRGPRLRDGVAGGVGYQEVLDGHQDGGVRPPVPRLGPGGALLFFPGDVLKEQRQRLDGEEHGPDTYDLRHAAVSLWLNSGLRVRPTNLGGQAVAVADSPLCLGEVQAAALGFCA
jgi:hypothetical protein